MNIRKIWKKALPLTQMPLETCQERAMVKLDQNLLQVKTFMENSQAS